MPRSQVAGVTGRASDTVTSPSVTLPVLVAVTRKRTTSPAAAKAASPGAGAGTTVLATDRPGRGATRGASTSAGSSTPAPPGAVPVPSASVGKRPASTAAWVTVRVAVQSSASPGASVTGSAAAVPSNVQASPSRPESVIVTPVSVWLPSFSSVSA